LDEAGDVVVIGAGINGAAISHALARAGFDVLLVDQGDIGSGTSQSSTMLIWGGLLYLKDWELRTVRALCRDRDRLIAGEPDLVKACAVRYLPTPGVRSPLVVGAAMHAYWLMGLARRVRPRRLGGFDERALIAAGNGVAWEFEEATLAASDARFVLEWVRRGEALGARARTYSRVTGVHRHGGGRWRIELTDTITGQISSVAATVVVNAAGPWADQVNRLAGVETPYRNALSRGVSLMVARDPRHHTHLVFDTADGNTLTLAPWGPVSLWASTESLHDTVADAAGITPHDVAELTEEYNHRFRTPLAAGDIVSVRAGVRPVPVERHEAVDAEGLGLSRHHRLHADESCAWITVYGGKLSGCRGLARETLALVRRHAAPARPARADSALAAPPTGAFAGVPGPVVPPAWTVLHEHCRTIEDYLRRRTNIAQWVPRGGFGRHDEHLDAIRACARAIHRGDEAAAARDLAEYRARVATETDLLAAVDRLLSPSSIGVPA
jgi:glycerol-3-phosphate dehydrogenase